MNTLLYPLNWQIGWALILGAFITGAGIGLFIHREGFLGGYQSYRRRMLRLGHIALAALGMLNVLFALTPWSMPAAGACFIVGGIAMPTVCFLAAWREKCRHLFFVPVVSLVVGVILVLINPNDEIRNPKQARSTNKQTSEATPQLKFAELPTFGFVSDFEFRISDLIGGFE